MASTSKRSARRCLFGRPDHERVNAWLKEQLDRIRLEKTAKWGFDFENDRPLENSEFDFEVVDIDSVPAFYRPKTVDSHVRSPASPTDSSPESENREPVSEEMDCAEPAIQTPKRRPLATPNKRLQQLKMTNYFVPKRQRLLRHPPKSVDTKTSPSSLDKRRTSVGSSR